MDRKSGFCCTGRPVPAMTTTIHGGSYSGWGRTARTGGIGSDGAIASFHVCAAITFVGADCTEAGWAVTGAKGVGEGASALELAKDSFFVVEEVANETIAMAFVHC